MHISFDLAPIPSGPSRSTIGIIVGLIIAVIAIIIIVKHIKK